MSDNSNNEYEDDLHDESPTNFQLPIDDDSGDENLDTNNDNVNLEIDVQNQEEANMLYHQ